MKNSQDYVLLLRYQQEMQIRINALQILGEVADQKAISMLLDILQNAEESPEIRSTAAQALVT